MAGLWWAVEAIVLEAIVRGEGSHLTGAQASSIDGTIPSLVVEHTWAFLVSSYNPVCGVCESRAI